MKRRSAWLSFAACALTAASPCVSRATTAGVQNSAPRPDLQKVDMVRLENGMTGFLDRRNGKLYLYDAALKECVGVRQVTQLGAPLTDLSD
jgi:hypothetical protein